MDIKQWSKQVWIELCSNSGITDSRYVISRFCKYIGSNVFSIQSTINGDLNGEYIMMVLG